MSVWLKQNNARQATNNPRSGNGCVFSFSFRVWVVLWVSGCVLVEFGSNRRANLDFINETEKEYNFGKLKPNHNEAGEQNQLRLGRGGGGNQSIN